MQAYTVPCASCFAQNDSPAKMEPMRFEKLVRFVRFVRVPGKTRRGHTEHVLRASCKPECMVFTNSTEQMAESTDGGILTVVAVIADLNRIMQEQGATSLTWQFVPCPAAPSLWSTLHICGQRWSTRPPPEALGKRLTLHLQEAAGAQTPTGMGVCFRLRLLGGRANCIQAKRCTSSP